jgi:hypothetical protein
MPGAEFIGVMSVLVVNCVSVARVPAGILRAISHQFLRLLVSRSSLIRDDVVESGLF